MGSSLLWPGFSRFVKCFSPVLSNIIIVKIIIIIIIVIVELSHIFYNKYYNIDNNNNHIPVMICTCTLTDQSVNYYTFLHQYVCKKCNSTLIGTAYD